MGASFFDDFGDAMVKMGGIGVVSVTSSGQVRVNCRKACCCGDFRVLEDACRDDEEMHTVQICLVVAFKVGLRGI